MRASCEHPQSERVVLREGPRRRRSVGSLLLPCPCRSCFIVNYFTAICTPEVTPSQGPPGHSQPTEPGNSLACPREGTTFTVQRSGRSLSPILVLSAGSSGTVGQQPRARCRLRRQTTSQGRLRALAVPLLRAPARRRGCSAGLRETNRRAFNSCAWVPACCRTACSQCT